jgi:hypothetical protein
MNKISRHYVFKPRDAFFNDAVKPTDVFFLAAVNC